MNRFYSVMLIFLLVLLGYLAFKIISPFLTAIAWAIVLSIIFYPVYATISRIIRINIIASVVTVMIIFVVIIGPITYLAVILVDELKVIATSINEGKLTSVRDMFENPQLTVYLDKISSYLGLETIRTQDLIIENMRKVGRGIIENLSIRFTNVIVATIDFVLVIFTTFFLLKDAPGFLSKAKNYLPFNETTNDKLATQVKDMVVSTVYGGILVAIVQGTLGGAAFYLLGIASPVIWGIAMSVMSFIPFLGAFSIWGPHAGYLLIQQQYLEGIALILIGFFVISLIDNILKPLIIGTRTQMPTIVIFFSVLGGIKLFGLIGLILGPLIMAVFISVFEIFRSLEGGTNAQS